MAAAATAAEQRARHLYGQLVSNGCIAKNIVPIGLLGTTTPSAGIYGVEVCFCADVAPKSLCSSDRRRAVVISCADESSYLIRPLHVWRQEVDEIVCDKELTDLFFQLELLALQARYHRF